MGFEYFKAGEEEQYVFFRFPWMLLRDPRYKDTISMHAKVLYGCMLDRQRISRRNGWSDEEGNIFIYYSLEEICEDMQVGRKKAGVMLNELEAVGLIRRVRQGLGKPNMIYVGKFFVSDGSNSPIWMGQKDTSGWVKNTRPDGSERASNKNNNIKTENIKINRIYPSGEEEDEMRCDGYGAISEREALEEYLEETCGFEALKHDEPSRKDEINEIRELILDVIMTRAPTVRISGEDKPAEVVKSRFMKLNIEHIRYVMDCLNKTTSDIKNIRQYLLAVLFNAPVTMRLYTNAEVNRDLARAMW